MTINSTKKIIVFLSAILICSSSFGMENVVTITTKPVSVLDVMKDKARSTFHGINSGINSMIRVPSNRVISDRTLKLAVGASLLPAAAAGAAVIFKEQSVSDDHRALIGAVIALPVATYLFTRNLRPTQQFKRHCDACDEIKKAHPIIKDITKLARLLGTDTEESNRELELWLVDNYSLKIDGLCPRIELQKEVKMLRAALETELQRMEEIVKLADDIDMEEIDKKYHNNKEYPSRSTDRLIEDKELISELIARITTFPEFGVDADRSIKAEKLNFEKQMEQGWSSRIGGIFKPLLGQAVVSVILLALLKAISEKLDLSIDWIGLQQMLRPVSISLEKAILIQPVDLAQ